MEGRGDPADGPGLSCYPCPGLGAQEDGEIFTTQPDYRLNQINLENYPLTPLAFYDAVEEVLRERQIG